MYWFLTIIFVISSLFSLYNFIFSIVILLVFWVMPRLPLEISEYIVDFLHSDEEALGQCCLVSKSWVPCARKHIFCEVGFEYSSHLEAWKEAFPDPANSPGYYTRSLYVRCLKDVTPADAEMGGWIRAFSNVVQLDLFICARNLHLTSIK